MRTPSPTSNGDRLLQEYRLKVDLADEASSGSHRGTLFDNRIALSVSEAAWTLGLSNRTIERLIKRGDLEAKRVSRRILIPKASIEAWLNRKD